jgi:hypothetical protein
MFYNEYILLKYQENVGTFISPDKMNWENIVNSTISQELPWDIGSLPAQYLFVFVRLLGDPFPGY